MPKPPTTPTYHPDKPELLIDYFEYLLICTRGRLQVDNKKLILKADGFRELKKEYGELKVDDFKKAWELAKQFNMWAEYFSGMANTIQKEFLDSNTHKQKIQAESSFDADSVKVANGDRLSNKDDRVVNARTGRNMYKSFYDSLTKMVEFLERSHYHCKSTYEMAKLMKDSPPSKKDDDF